MKNFLYIAILFIFCNSVFAQKPQEMNDGLEVGDLTGAGLSQAAFSRLDSAILNGTFKNITSILVARNGKLVYEKYYNGASDTTLHNTRSATKTITAILTGLAIDHHYISSESAPVFPYFKDKKISKIPIYVKIRLLSKIF